MAEKDVTQKTLEAMNDVFADIMNACLFGGEQLAKAGELKDLHPVSAYEVGGKLRSMERDVSKIWSEGAINIACVGVENQSTKDNTMPLRVFAYDGAEYRRQLGTNEKKFIPVVTLVLYFGKEPWVKPDRLFDVVEVAPKLKPFVNDYKINIIDVSHMTLEQAKLFKSDFYLIADYFAQVNAYGSYKKSRKRKMKHQQETFRFMHYLTGDEDFENLLPVEEGGPSNMYDAFKEFKDKAEARGEKRGEKRGREIGKGMGENRMGQLLQKLLALGRIDEGVSQILCKLHLVAKPNIIIGGDSSLADGAP